MFFAAAAAAILALWFGIHPSFATSTQTSPQPTAATAPQVIVIQPTPPAAPSSTPAPNPTTSPASAPTQAAPPPAPSTSKAAPPPPASTSKAAPPPPPSTSKPAPPTQIKTVSILNYAANGSMDVNTDNFNDGQPIGIWETNHTPAQSWTIWVYPSDNASLVIQSTDKPESAGTKVLQVDPNNATDVDISDDWNGVAGLQAHLTADFQQWTLTSIPGNTTYGVLKNKHTGTCIASTGMHGFLTMAPCNTGDQKQWFWLFAL